MSVSSEDQRAEECCRIWGRTRCSLGAETILRMRIRSPARTEPPAGPEEIRPQLPPGENPGALSFSVMPGWFVYHFTAAWEHSDLLSLTNEKARLKWIILALLSHRPIRYIYLKLNIKTYLFSLLVHRLSPLPLPQMGYIMKAETSGNSSFPYEYLILQFEKVQKYQMYLILMWPPGERVKGDFAKGECVCVCWVGRKESMQ